MNYIKNWLKRIITYYKEKPVTASALLAFIMGLGCAFVLYILLLFSTKDFRYFFPETVQVAVAGVIAGFFMIYPLILSVMNVILLFFPKKRIVPIELITLGWGGFCTAIYLWFCEIPFSADRNVQLQNTGQHTLIFTQAAPTVIVLLCIALAGYLVLSFVPLKKLPPPVTVLCFATLCIGIGEAILWIVQLWGYFYLNLYSVNCILVILKLMQYKIKEWREIHPF
ncbi:MAG: hypothetical protein NC254_02505 [bacterium]|nr:hypothetical protein [bacterium]